MTKKAVIIFSGGLDSSTVLAVAKSAGYECHCLTFSYTQKHSSEILASERVAKALGAASHKIFQLDIGQFGGSSLTDADADVPDHQPDAGIPSTYVPARNTIFLSVALGYAEVLAADAVFIGVSSIDYSGYPDCRPEYIAAFQNLANLATKVGVEGKPIAINTPLIQLSKAETIQLGLQHGVDYSMTVSCYRADDEGRACGRCDSCVLRQQGFAEAGVVDPTRYVGVIE